ncbi:hypothetical protein [Maridesulfovibrio frigidus]|uniref:hypothetical protein n=1 Tax=Maridesulfovibrio frigidus TaxID=340956 RepID=UPI0004E0E4AE|nr:hypothetical protein [Maridesulfovibrio frigidus]
MKKYLAVLLSLFFLVGWGDVSLDTSSEKEFKSSAGALIKDMSVADKDALRKSFATIVSNGEIKRLGSDVRLPEVYALGQQQEAWGDILFMKRLKELDGFTVEQINDRAAVIVKEQHDYERLRELERLRKKLKQYSTELEELKKCNAAREQAKAVIPKLKIEKTYVLNELMSVTGKPMGKIESADVKVSIHNNSGKDIQSIKLKFQLKSGDRQAQDDEVFKLTTPIKAGQSDSLEYNVGTHFSSLKLLPNQVEVLVVPIKVETVESARYVNKHFYKTESEYLGVIRGVEGRIGALEGEIVGGLYEK